MISRLSLRLRVFLFFALLALGAGTIAAIGLFIGWSRTGGGLPIQPFLTAFFLIVFLHTGLAVAVWLLFDENVAKPIEKLASSLRLRAHSGVEAEVDTGAARYLGDLAPAASAITSVLNRSLVKTASHVAEETEKLQQETARLTNLLTEIPVATLLINRKDEIVLYDGQAAMILSGIARPRLKAPLSEYFDTNSVLEALRGLGEGQVEAAFRLPSKSRAQFFEARLKKLESGGYILLLETSGLSEARAPARPLVYDFDLLNREDEGNEQDLPLNDLCFVVFDTETTGLNTAQDDVVQIGAVRILNGRILPGEVFDSYVNPGRSISAASTRIHGVRDVDVADAPDFPAAGRSFHEFCQGAVLVAHNAPFDLAFLRRFEGEMGVRWTHPILDTVLLSAIAFGITEDHSLDALCGRLGITIPPDLRHSAIGDARATAEALIRLIPLLQARSLTTLQSVILEAKRSGRLIQDMN